MTVVRSNYAPVPNNLYQTEPWATRVALRKILLPPGAVVWEASAGGHKMADVLRAFGFDVLTSDIAEYRRRHDFLFDFLDTTATVPSRFCDAIITNPPYGPQNRLAAAFARLALLRCPGLVALLLSAKFDSGSSRRDLFQDNPRFLCKIVLTDRIRWFACDYEGTEDHAWFVWGPSIGPPYDFNIIMRCKCIPPLGTSYNNGSMKRRASLR